jgi:integration host factor subunit beta
MTKSDIIKKLSENMSLKKKIAEEVIDTIFDSMKEALVSGDKVEIRGFGTFKVKSYKAYEGRNPRTGEIINVKPKKLPFFKIGKELKDKINS